MSPLPGEGPDIQLDIQLASLIHFRPSSHSSAAKIRRKLLDFVEDQVYDMIHPYMRPVARAERAVERAERALEREVEREVERAERAERTKRIRRTRLPRASCKGKVRLHFVRLSLY